MTLRLLTCRDMKFFINDDDLLLAELKNRGIEPVVQPWEELDPTFSGPTLIRTTWNYTEHLSDFLQTLKSTQGSLWNPLPVVEWNCNKSYLVELFKQGLKVLPTYMATNQNELEQAISTLGGNDFIVKPAVGASAIGLHRFKADAPPTLQEASLVQRFHPEIVKGEVSLFYFNGQFAYAAKKVPKSGDIRVQEEYGGQITHYEPDPELIAQANKIVESIPQPWLYARVDMIPGQGLIELECIEPSLYLRHCPQGASLFVDALLKRL